MSFRRYASLAIALLVPAVWLAGTAQSQSVAAGSLVIAATTPPDTLDPQKSALNQTWPAWQLSYECLLRATADGKISPLLASKYVVNDARTVYDFTLRQGVRFHDGQLLKPTDVVYTFDRLRTQGIPYAQNRFPTLQSVSPLTARSVRFTLSRPDPGFLLNMGDPFAVGCAILSQKAGQSSDLTTTMVGTGPFAVVSVRADARVADEAASIVTGGSKRSSPSSGVAYTPEASAQLVALLSGKADLIFPDPSIVRALKGANKTVKIGSVIAATTLRVEMSAAKAPFNDVEVRRAIELAIDKPAAIRGAYLGYGAPASHIPRGYAWGPALRSYAYTGKSDMRRRRDY